MVLGSTPGASNLLRPTPQQVFLQPGIHPSGALKIPTGAAQIANGANPHMINSAGKPLNAMTPVQKDTTFTKIFVGGLPYGTTDDALRKYFEVYGEIEEAVVICDRVTQKSRGYGFVSTHPHSLCS